MKKYLINYWTGGIITGIVIAMLIVSVSGIFVKKDTKAGAAGTEIPTVVALFDTSLATAISSTATSMTLVSATDKDGNTLASSTYPFIIDEGTASEELVIADCTGTTCTNMIRGVSVLTGTTTVSSLKKSHRRGASVKITDGPQLMILSRMLNGQGSLPNLINYLSGTACTAGSSDQTICDKAYYDNLANQGAATSTETVAGIVELATALETASSTQFDSDNPHVINSEMATDTPTMSTASATKVVVSDLTGYIKQGWINLTETFSFAIANFSGLLTANGGLTSTATSTFDGSDVNSNAIVINSIAYQFPSADGSSGQSLQTNGSGILSWSDVAIPRYTLSYTTGFSVSTEGGSLTYATSTGLAIPANTLTASSTAEVKGDISCQETGSNGGTCKIYVRDATGANIASCSVGITNSATNGGSFDIFISSDNSTSAQKSTCLGTYGTGGNVGIGFWNTESTSAIDFSAATTFYVVVESDSINLSSQGVVITVNP